MRILFTLFFTVFIAVQPFKTYAQSTLSDRIVSENDYVSLIHFADSCLDAYDVYNAMEAYQRALKVHDNSYVRRRIATCHYRRAEFNDCLEMLKTISKLDNDSLDHEALRQMFYSNGRLGRASAQAYWGTQVLERYPNDSEIVAALASVYNSESLNEPFNGLKYTTAYLAKDSTNLAVMRQHADAHFFMKDFKEAARWYERLQERGDSTFNTLYSLGMSYWNVKRLPEAASTLRHAAEINGYKSAGCMYRLGLVYSEMDSLSLAVKSLEKAISLLRPDASIMFVVNRALAECYSRKGEYHFAQIYYNAAIRENRDDAMTYFNAAIVCGKTNDKRMESLYYNNFLSLASEMEQTSELKDMIAQANAVIEQNIKKAAQATPKSGTSPKDSLGAKK